MRILYGCGYPRQQPLAFLERGLSGAFIVPDAGFDDGGNFSRETPYSGLPSSASGDESGAESGIDTGVQPSDLVMHSLDADDPFAACWPVNPELVLLEGFSRNNYSFAGPFGIGLRILSRLLACES